MRIWHYELLPYLPDKQFRGQLRELVAILHDWKYKGKTNHLLINKVMEYPKSDLWIYFIKYHSEYVRRYGKFVKDEIYQEFASFPKELEDFRNPFPGWHNTKYLRVCMANLYEKHFFASGKNCVTKNDWIILLRAYKKITGEDYYV